MSKRVFFGALAVLSCVVLLTAAAQADTISVTGSFTSFSGTVSVNGSNTYDFCPASTCATFSPGPYGTTICPDAGCVPDAPATSLAFASNVPISGNPSTNTNPHLYFDYGGLVSNALIFQSARDPGSSFLNDVSPGNQFRLGTLTFANGLWTGNANIGFSIVANDLTTHDSRQFDGYIHMVVTSPNTGTPQQNADYIYFVDTAGNPVVDPLTLKPLPSIRAYELADSPTGSNTVTVDLYGKFGSLDLTTIDNATGGGFLDVSLTPELGGPPSSAVPEPETLALLGSGALSLVAFRKRTSSQRPTKQ